MAARRQPWEIARPERSFEIKIGGRVEHISDGQGGYRARWVDARSMIGVPLKNWRDARASERVAYSTESLP